MRTERLMGERLDRLHQLMAGYVERGEVPGLVCAVSQLGGVHVDVIGKQAIDGDLMQRNTIFRIASMTKPITAAATMSLIDDGRLNFHDPVDALLPELADRRVLKRLDGPLDDTVPANRPITVRDLLTFRLGFGLVLAPPGTNPIQREIESLELGLGPPSPSLLPEPDEWIRRLGTLPLMHQPGERWMYNAGSDVLGVLIARASGQTFERFLNERIFGPLGMNDTGFHVPANAIHRLATSYGTNPDTGMLQIHDPAEDGDWSRPPAFPSGAGGLVSTVDDYLAFALMLLNKGMHGTERILSESSVELMTTNHLTADQRQGAQPFLEEGQGWGFGVSVATRSTPKGAAGSYGWNGGLGTTWMTEPTVETVALLLTQVNWTSPTYPAISRNFLKAAVGSTND